MVSSVRSVAIRWCNGFRPRASIFTGLRSSHELYTNRTDGNRTHGAPVSQAALPLGYSPMLGPLGLLTLEQAVHTLDLRHRYYSSLGVRPAHSSDRAAPYGSGENRTRAERLARPPFSLLNYGPEKRSPVGACQDTTPAAEPHTDRTDLYVVTASWCTSPLLLTRSLYHVACVVSSASRYSANSSWRATIGMHESSVAFKPWLRMYASTAMRHGPTWSELTTRPTIMGLVALRRYHARSSATMR